MQNYGHKRTDMHEMIEKADLVIAVGTMFKGEDTGNWSVPFPGNLIHIDIDSEEFGRNYKPAVAIRGDARTVLQQLLAEIDDMVLAENGWVGEFRKVKEGIIQKRRNENPQEMRILQTIRKAAPRDAVIVCDRCSIGYWANEYLETYHPRTYQYPMGFGTLGYGLPAAIGAKLGRPDREVLCIVGDAGFQFSMSELATAVQYDIPITILMANDNGYAAIRNVKDSLFDGRRFAVDLKNPDFCRLVESYGVSAVRIGRVDQLEGALRSAMRSRKLEFIEFRRDTPVP